MIVVGQTRPCVRVYLARAAESCRMSLGLLVHLSCSRARWAELSGKPERSIWNKGNPFLWKIQVNTNIPLKPTPKYCPLWSLSLHIIGALLGHSSFARPQRLALIKGAGMGQRIMHCHWFNNAQSHHASHSHCTYFYALHAWRTSWTRICASD